ncbi:gamma carbonic anhydrase family protein [bacterium]|nr:gamma carbonic anhydrase family protein [bacterium]
MGQPELGADVFIAPGAHVIGNVRLGRNASVWYNAVLRGDINSISIGDGTNLQDGVIVHLENDIGCLVGDDVTVGHGAILHGCTVEDAVVVGMGAIILNGAVIGTGSIIGAGAVVREHQIIPPLSMVVGVPGKIVKTLEKETINKNKAWAKKYVKLAACHRERISVVERTIVSGPLE